MPTGYTATPYDGDPETFEEFVLTCARAMGALIALRDEAPNARIPDGFEPASYHLDALNKAKREVSRLRRMSPDEAQAEAERERVEWEAALVAEEATRVARKGRYEAMLAQVCAWVPPTPEHQGLKDFMEQQLVDSIKFDCSHYEVEAPTAHGPTWLAAALARAERDVTYQTEERDKEVARAAERTAWVQALKGSLSGIPAEAKA